MTRYERVLKILDTAIGGPTAVIGVHGAFWRGLSRDEFVAKQVRGLQLVTLNDGANSALVHALKGEAPFGADLPEPPSGALFSRMPASRPPVPEPEIAFVQRWIDEGCLEDKFIDEADQGERFVWRETNAPVASSRTDDIWFIDPLEGWAINSNGQIVHTADGGETWEVQLQANAYFRSIGMANAQRGWAGTLTLPRRMFETSNGGASWQQVANLPALAPSAVCGLAVVNERVVYASGTNYPDRPARMMKTVDGGQTWTAWEMAPWADLLVDCFFTSQRSGWVVGGKSNTGNPTRANVRPVVLRTEDGGVTWTNQVAALAFPLGEWGWKIQFLNADIGFVSLESFQAGAILKTTDGGRSWVRLAVNDSQRNANLEGVGFIDAQIGWVGGWGDADFQRLSSSATEDGGVTWRDANEIGHAINRFRFCGNPVTVGYASGVTVYKYEKAAPRALVATRSEELAKREIPRIIQRTRGVDRIYLPLGQSKAGQHVTVTIYSRFGDEVATFGTTVEKRDGGACVSWNMRDAQEQPVSAGHYIVRFTTDSDVVSCLLRLSEEGHAAALPKQPDLRADKAPVKAFANLKKKATS